LILFRRRDDQGKSSVGVCENNGPPGAIVPPMNIGSSANCLNSAAKRWIPGIAGTAAVPPARN